MDTKENAAKTLMGFCYENQPLNYTQVALDKTASVTKVDRGSRPGFPLAKFLNKKKKRKKWTHPRFLHRGPKKAVD